MMSGDRSRRPRHDKGHADLAQALVGDADHRRLGDVGVAQQRVLDLGRIGVEAADDEHVLGPADDAQAAGRRSTSPMSPVRSHPSDESAWPWPRDRRGSRHDAAAAQHHLTRLSRRATSIPSSTMRSSKPGRGRPTVVAMVSTSSSGEVATAVPASVSP
jgi:hypothetical protein